MPAHAPSTKKKKGSCTPGIITTRNQRRSLRHDCEITAHGLTDIWKSHELVREEVYICLPFVHPFASPAFNLLLNLDARRQAAMDFFLIVIPDPGTQVRVARSLLLGRTGIRAASADRRVTATMPTSRLHARVAYFIRNSTTASRFVSSFALIP